MIAICTGYSDLITFPNVRRTSWVYKSPWYFQNVSEGDLHGSLLVEGEAKGRKTKTLVKAPIEGR